ncbi:DUF6712 family protein [Hymenobacter sp. PAMC 26628]|uniref:DUF6712 family protein n=1 Tax=Hymenobacter sp. PAMC 26628 TaxID=1484118 RepID=UPI0007703FC7|nr:DUF6712 family protein [Hymenobacter sp. PAMC 26628]AMJ65044.1 hypothetical protein AXW84_06085 [Hymenobacter sp. PAMC 26628]
MALLKTTEEFRAGLPVNVTSSIDLLAGALAAAERRHIVPVLGRAQYNELRIAYDAGTLSPLQAELLAVVQAALANLAYAPYITIAQLDISDSGIRIQTDDNHKTAFQWQIDDLREYVTEAGYTALEDALGFLDDNKAAFPLWATSAAYTYNKELLLNSAPDFDKCYRINGSRRTFLALVPLIRQVEHFALEPVLSAAFCQALRDELATGAVGAPTAAVLKLLHPALANLTVAEAVLEMGVDLTPGGLVVQELDKTTTNNRVRKQASETVLALKRNQALETGRAYLRDLVELLNKTASTTVYAAYFSSDRYTAPAPPPDPNAQPAPPRVGGLYGAC